MEGFFTPAPPRRRRRRSCSLRKRNRYVHVCQGLGEHGGLRPGIHNRPGTYRNTHATLTAAVVALSLKPPSTYIVSPEITSGRNQNAQGGTTLLMRRCRERGLGRRRCWGILSINKKSSQWLRRLLPRLFSFWARCMSPGLSRLTLVGKFHSFA